jgi:hypothetical protein
MRPFALSGALAATLTLLVQPTPRAQDQAPSLEGYPAVGSPATVALLSAGAEPRRPLRYRIAAGYKDTMTMSMAMSMAMTMGEVAAPVPELPSMKITAELAVTNVADNGDVTYDLAFTGMTPEAGPGVDPSLVEAMRQSAAGITTVKGIAIVSNRGVNRSARLDVDKLADPNLRQMLSSFSSSVESMSMPLPEEAVGAGARWEVRQALQSAGAATFQRGEYELVSMDERSVALRVTFEQTAPRQTITNPALPAGATMEVEKITGSGSGTVTLRLDGLIPTAELSSTTTALMNASMGGQSQRLTIDTKITLKMAPDK